MDKFVTEQNPNAGRKSLITAVASIVYLVLFVLEITSVHIMSQTHESLSKAANFFEPDSVGMTVALILGLIGGFLIILAVHEMIHFTIDWYYTGKKPKLGKQGLYSFYVSLPIGVYLVKSRYLTSTLGPIISITVMGLLLMFILPIAVMPFTLFAIISNLSASTSDVFQSVWILKKKKTALFGFNGIDTISIDA